ncbi:MAG: hypothetical protein MHM6MM_002539 [Cercozoa sp. M6MM]
MYSAYLGRHAQRRLKGTLIVDNPFTGGVACKVALPSDEGCVSAVQDSHRAFKSWRTVPLQDRMALVDRFIDRLSANTDSIASDVSRMMGKPYHHAQGEVKNAVARAKYLLSVAQTSLADQVIAQSKTGVRTIRKEPVGVVAVLSPWNYPLLCTVNVLVPAILAGNAVLVKHSERSPLVAEHFATAFKQAGAPDFLVQPLHATQEQLHAKVLTDPLVGYVAFTGSVQGGRAVYETVASRHPFFCDVGLELGGNDAAYVACDANVKEAAAGIAEGGFFNAGQSCCAVERVFAHASVYDELLRELQLHAEAQVLGDPLEASTTMGPLAQPHHAEHVQAHVDDAVKKGARVLCGGHARGRFFEPTVLADATPEMRVMREETFGPLLPVMRVSCYADALELINDCTLGLTASIWTEDAKKADNFARDVSVGTVFQNGCDNPHPSLPWSGRRESGKGLSLSHLVFDSVTAPKSLNLRRSLMSTPE